MDKPYYFTWSEQNNPDYLQINDLNDHGYVLEDGRFIADLCSISFQCSFGHKPIKLISAIKTQLDQFPVMPPPKPFTLKKIIQQICCWI